MTTGPISYKDSGVDIVKGEELVSKIKDKVKSTYGDRVYEGVGGFASLYDMGDGRLISAGTDGVGTKLMLAQVLNRHNTIGIDLVAMCVNDILCTGSRPLFFMDYLATGKLDVEISEAVIEGIVEGCKQSKMALIGGETAEMPGMYSNGEYDLAGFAVGEVTKEGLINGKDIKEGDSLIGIASSGFHSNGYSLVRKLFNESETSWLEKALIPTKIYVKLVSDLLNQFKGDIKGLAHITGGGIDNIPRMNGDFDYILDSMPRLTEIPEVFKEAKTRSKLDDKELYQTFNMGVGFVIACSKAKEHEIMQSLASRDEKAWIIGHITKGTGQTKLLN
jgi:phosphoribosylformylglycinamidine cyclo-ligase